MQSTPEEMERGLRAIIEITEGHDEYTMPELYACNYIAKRVLEIPVVTHNHDDWENAKADCERCKYWIKYWRDRKGARFGE